MTTTSSETVTVDDFAVITLVTRLHAAAAAGRKLLEVCERVCEGEEGDSAWTWPELMARTTAARAAYDRLAEIDTQDAP